ncbi:hypothetical protein KO527_05065 [Pseudoalteromonas sp. C2R02]|uniref:hypothetical protein n=1 Tax=Pseudoalteromonas sp. C2R02 TaxID=2841565 RepID=UPI001C0A1DA5|nr:hypothetical protein [Pseudoalteromonas sp. C2R02]MBU2968717.1 hypothetical protein [Pseudoalteromonas sp. C2R02]
MKWTESTVTKLLITDAPKLDPVTVYLENYNLGQGKLTIEVFGESWSASWGAMGSRNLEQFVLDCDNHYLSKNLATLSALSEEDYEGFVDNIRSNIVEWRRNGDYEKSEARELWELTKEIEPEKEYFHSESNHDLLYKLGGCEWYHYIPSKDSSVGIYLDRILDAVKSCLKERETKKAA